MSNGVEGIIASVDTIGIDRSAIEQDKLDIANKVRRSLFPWRGQFSPELIELLIEAYASPNSTLLDPFCGSGTVLFEAARKNLSCYATEISPAAIEMARTAWFINQSDSERGRIIAKANGIIQKYAPLLSENTLHSYGTERVKNKSIVEIFREMISESKNDPHVHNFILNVLIRYDMIKEGRDTNFQRLLEAFKQHKKIVSDLPYNGKKYKVYLADCRKLPLDDGVIDLIVTSPPYINVFNYHQNCRQSMETVGWDVLAIAKSEIGSNRKNRGNRFLTVIQYSIDMMLSLIEMRRVLKPSGRAIIVIGRESKVRGISFENYLILVSLAIGGAGLKLISRQERKFVNRFGDVIYEDILHLGPNGFENKNPIDFARCVSVFFLKKALLNAKASDVRQDLEDAIRRADNVEPSPLLMYSNNYKVTQ